MRLSEHDQQAIRDVCAEVAGLGARVYLFGSRVHDDLRGGDIDLWVDLPASGADKFAISTRFGARLQRLIGERKIDVLVTDPESADTPIILSARHSGVAL